jgi:hypothetical protein
MNKVMDFVRDHPVVTTAVVAYLCGHVIGFLLGVQF